MPRYVIERTFPGGIRIPMDPVGARALRGVVANNTKHGVTWLHSYVSEDLGRSYCVYDAPSPEALREAARSNGHPVDRITSVRVLNPYFYLPDGGTGDGP